MKIVQFVPILNGGGVADGERLLASALPCVCGEHSGDLSEHYRQRFFSGLR
jgi:hypothetical protein